MADFLFGVVVGAILSPILIRLAKLGIDALSKNVAHLENKQGDKQP